MAPARAWSPLTLEALQAKLEEERQLVQAILNRLQYDLRQAGEARAHEHGVGTYPADAASDMTFQAEALAQIERLREQLADIVTALQCVEDGTYGVCEDCGRSIPVGRLLALPTARRDLACQQDREAHTPRLSGSYRRGTGLRPDPAGFPGVEEGRRFAAGEG